MTAPAVDTRPFEKILEDLGALAADRVDEWRPTEGQDVGLGLSAVYAHFLEILLDRLNRAPDKNLLAFLDMIGIGRLAPAAASAPLVFTLTATAGDAAVVAAGTQVATQQTETEPAVVFETQSALSVIAAQLVAAQVVDPDRDRWTDVSAVAAGAEQRVFAPFRGERRIAHLMHVGHERVFAPTRPARLLVDLTARDPAVAARVFGDVDWEVRTEDGWAALGDPTVTVEPVTGEATDDEDDKVVRIAFDDFAGAAAHALSGPGIDAAIERRWLRARLAGSIAELDDGTLTGSALFGITARIEQQRSRVRVRPPLDPDTKEGSEVRRLVPSTTTATTLVVGASGSSLQLTTPAGFGDGDLVLVGDGDREEVVELAGDPESDGDVALTAKLRTSHDAGEPVRRLVEPAGASPPPAPTVTSVSADTVDLDLASAFEPGDVLVADDSAGRVVAVNVGIPPDQVHVNAAPADFSKPFVAFGLVPRPGDALQIASADAFARPDEQGETQVAVDLTVRIGDAEVEWAYWGDGDVWKPLALDPADDESNGLTTDGTIQIGALADAEPVELRDTVGTASNYHLVRVTLAAGGYVRVPTLASVTVGGDAPDGVWVSTTVPADPTAGPERTDGGPAGPLAALDPADWILPFGAEPGAGASFYVGVTATGNGSGGMGALDLQVTTPAPPALTWDYLGPAGWTGLSVDDETRSLTRSGQVTFPVPPDVVIGEVNGQKSAWIRAVIASGSYGRPLELVQVNPANPAQGFAPRQGTGAPNAPVISRVAVRFTASTPAITVVSGDDFLLRDDTAGMGDRALRPFRPVPDEEPALYLGFDRPLPNRAMRLFFVVPPRQFAELLEPGAEGPASDPAPELAWEYWNGREWSPLTLVDQTTSLAESGAVDVTGPTDMAPLVRGAVDPRWWVRVRRAHAGETYAPVLSHVLLNATEAVQAATVERELLGSSAGRRNETFQTARRPVLPEQSVVVIEPERPPEPERGEALDWVEAPGGYEVRWEEVPSLRSSTPRDRHYTIDRIAGAITFGDGDHGLIPPAGTDNVICERYRSGGGAAGNAAAGAISQLKSSIPYVAAVTNPIPAGGGSDEEGSDAAKLRGPQTVRNRGRAVSSDDLESLAREASGTSVARARALPSRNRELRFAPGWTTLVIVPEGKDPRLLPSAALVDRVTEEIASRSLATLAGAAVPRLNVIGPGYVPVEVRAAIVPRDLAEGEAARAGVFAALKAFLHPLSGGQDGTGWPLGRDVFVSELFAALERVPGIEHVDRLAFAPTAAVIPLVFDDAPELAAEIAAGGEVARIDSKGRDVVRARLVETIPKGAAPSGAMAVLFQEGERIRIGSGAAATETTIRAISGTTLRVDPFRSEDADHPEGAAVVAVAPGPAPAGGAITPKPRRSELTTRVESGVLLDSIEVRGFRPGDVVQLRPPVTGEPPDTAEPADPDSPQPATKAIEAALLEATEAGTRQLVLGSQMRIPESHLPYSGSHVVDLVGA